MTDEELVQAAYTERQDRMIHNLEDDLRFRERVLAEADQAFEVVWSQMRKQGHADRRAERDAYLLLLDQVRSLKFPAGGGG